MRGITKLTPTKLGEFRRFVRHCTKFSQPTNQQYTLIIKFQNLLVATSYPAYYSECISVAAVSKKDGFPVARFSNSNVEMDYSGIGVDAVSFKPGGGVRKLSGTSMACPHVCGFLACILQKHGVDTSDKELRKILNENYAIDIGLEGTDNATGIGFLSYLDESAFDAILPRKAMTPAQTE